MAKSRTTDSKTAFLVCTVKECHRNEVASWYSCFCLRLSSTLVLLVYWYSTPLDFTNYSLDSTMFVVYLLAIFAIKEPNLSLLGH